MTTRRSAVVSPSAIASLSINKQLITNNYHQRLLYAHSSADMTTYLKDRNDWDQRTFDSVDWEHLEAAILPKKKRSKTHIRKSSKIHDRHAKYRTTKAQIYSQSWIGNDNNRCLPVLQNGWRNNNAPLPMPWSKTSWTIVTSTEGSPRYTTEVPHVRQYLALYVPGLQGLL